MEDRWLSVDEMVDYLCVHKDTIYNWIKDRNLPAYKVGRLWKIKQTKLDSWVESGGAKTSAKQ